VTVPLRRARAYLPPFVVPVSDERLEAPPARSVRGGPACSLRARQSRLPSSALRNNPTCPAHRYQQHLSLHLSASGLQRLPLPLRAERALRRNTEELAHDPAVRAARAELARLTIGLDMSDWGQWEWVEDPRTKRVLYRDTLRNVTQSEPPWCVRAAARWDSMTEEELARDIAEQAQAREELAARAERARRAVDAAKGGVEEVCRAGAGRVRSELLSRSRNTVSRGHVTPQVDAFLAQEDRRLMEEALDLLSADIDAAAAEARPALSARLRDSQLCTEGGTRRVQLVRKEGRDVSTLYGREGGGVQRGGWHAHVWRVSTAGESRDP